MTVPLPNEFIAQLPFVSFFRHIFLCASKLAQINQEVDYLISLIATCRYLMWRPMSSLHLVLGIT